MVDVDSGHVGAVDGRSLNGSPLNHGHHRRSLAMLKAPARGSAQGGGSRHGARDGSSAAGSGLGKSMSVREGSTRDSPVMIASPVRSDGSTSARPETLSGNAARILDWSAELVSRKAIRVPHWARAVSGSADGR